MNRCFTCHLPNKIFFFLHFNIFFQRAIWLYVRLYCWDQNSRLPRPFFKGFLLFFFFLLQNKKSMQRAEKSISTSYQVCKHLKRGQNTQQINNQLISFALNNQCLVVHQKLFSENEGTTSFFRPSIARPSFSRIGINTDHSIGIYSFPDLILKY